MTRREQSALKRVHAAILGPDFEGDAHKAFRKFDVDEDTRLSTRELEALLLFCGVGNEWTIGKWTSRVLEEMDRDDDGHVSAREVRERFGPDGLPTMYEVQECNDPNCVARRGKTLQSEKDRGGESPGGEEEEL